MNRVLDCRAHLFEATFCALMCAALSVLLSVALSASPNANASKAALATQNLNVSVRLTHTTYGAHAAFRLSDGRSEAIIVPEIGRVMSYRLVGGKNMLWNNPAKDPTIMGWKNWGGDKNWMAPQTAWPALSGTGWPPDKAWDGSPFRAQVLSGARLRTTSPVSKSAGVRIIREYAMNAQGELEIAQIAEKVSGAPFFLSIWNITQTQPDAVFLPLNARSIYKNGFFWFDREPRIGARIEVVTPTLLRYLPLQKNDSALVGGYKIGVDSRVAAIVAVKDKVAFVQKTNFGEGSYPDGPERSGCPVELFDSGQTTDAKHYIELELLSPLRLMTVGARWKNTLKWSLQKLKSSDPNAPETFAEVTRLMPAPLK